MENTGDQQLEGRELDPSARMCTVNFAREIVEAAAPERLALVELARDGARREWSFGEVAERSARLSGALQDGVCAGGTW